MNQKGRDRDDEDWVDRTTALAGKLGFNEIRVRWKLEGVRKRLAGVRFRATEQAGHVRYEHKICTSCGRLNAGDAEQCVRCEEPLGGHRWHMFQRLGLSLPFGLNLSALLGLAMIAVYGRLIWATDGEGILSFSVATLVHFGGNWTPAVLGFGELWRLGTSIFLHAGLWHLGFNLYALTIVGPTIEEVFGRGRMLLFFMVTGLVASLASTVAGGGVSIGASGALMGLIGLAAGWGHRDGTSIGREIRNRMVRWSLLVVVFGIFIGADNVAHVAGFLAGGVIGLAFPPEVLARSSRPTVIVVQYGLGAAAAILSVVLCLLPPSSRADELLRAQLEAASSAAAQVDQTEEPSRAP